MVWNSEEWLEGCVIVGNGWISVGMGGNSGERWGMVRNKWEWLGMAEYGWECWDWLE